MAAPISHPLIPDYVKRNSRGAAIAISGVGLVFGEVLSMGILFNLTKNMSFYSAFAIAALLIFMFSILFLFIIKDPDFEMIRTDSKSKHNFRTLKRK
jgi:sugar phosphate permease